LISAVSKDLGLLNALQPAAAPLSGLLGQDNARSPSANRSPYSNNKETTTAKTTRNKMHRHKGNAVPAGSYVGSLILL